MTTVDAAVSLLHLFGDTTRVRLLALLAEHELSVAELTTITQLPQSRVSTHLGRLREAGLLRDRRVGASTLYALNDVAMPDAARRVWQLMESTIDDRLVETDRKRCEKLRAAQGTATSWPDTIAGEMERHYSPGRTWEATARGLIGFVTLGDVLDLGSGDGAIATLLAPRSKTLTCLDKSEKMIAAVKKRFNGNSNVTAVAGDMQALPFDDARFDQIWCSNALSYAEHPARALKEAARVLRPGGRMVLVTLDQHNHPDVTAAYGHVHPGFSPEAARQMLTAAGLDVESAAVTSRELEKPYFRVVTALAQKPAPARAPKQNGKH